MLTHTQTAELAAYIRSYIVVLDSDQQSREGAVLLRKAAAAIDDLMKETEELRRLINSVRPATYRRHDEKVTL